MSGTQPDQVDDLRVRIEQLAEASRFQVARVEQLFEREAVLTGRVEQLVERNAALAAEIRAGREPARPRLPRRLAVGLASALAVLVALAPLAVLAVVDLFGDVPTGAQFHDEINAIARAGITTGCSAGTPPNYCPDDAVTRRAMAAFMSRGFGRVTGKSLPTMVGVPTTDVGFTSWSVTITPGLPAGALSGAAGFLKADAWVTVSTLSGTGTCGYVASLLLDDTAVGFSPLAVVDDASINNVTIPLTAAAKVTGSTAKTVQVRVRRTSGGCVANAFGGLSVIYAPFGGTGTNTL